MRHNRNIVEVVKDYLWGDGLDVWNTPKHEIHDYPLTNPLQDAVIWGNKLGPAAYARHHLDKFMSGDYDSLIKEAVDYLPTIRRRRFRPAVFTANYKSSGSSSRAYQQNGSPGDTSSLAEKAVAYGGLAYLGYKYATEDMYKLPLSSRKCRPGFVKKKIGGKWMCVRKHSRKK